MIRAAALLRASHPAPAFAVTALSALLAVGAGLELGTGALVTAAVGTGQLSIGWSNDLLDEARDRAVARPDKPIAVGEVSASAVRLATGWALAAAVVLSLASGWRSGFLYLLLGVGSGWAYNLVLKRTVWSAVPYALAFGSLPAVVTLALPDPVLPAWWALVAGALIGVGAHLLNALPDLSDDAATGVHGLPHRLGGQRVRRIAPVVLLAGSATATLGPGVPASAGPWLAFGASLALAVLASTGRGRVPFLAAIGIALAAVVGLVIAT